MTTDTTMQKLADNTTKVVVAMSGGVDSSVAALLLKEQGYDIVGASLQVWDYKKNGGSSSRATCCAPNDFLDARKVAAALGVPYYVLDFEQHFEREVIAKFVAEYEQGKTPNPCVDCNNKVKFRELRTRALGFGYRAVATGHYAQITKDDAGYHLLRGVDDKKDQTYFLYGLQQDELSSTLFPVGHLTKDAVRAIARDSGLITAEKPESMDICFVSDSVREFLKRRGVSTADRGDIRTASGQIVGQHEGVHNFTVGQRRGLGVSTAGKALYVLDLDPTENSVLVGDREDLRRESFWVTNPSWVAPQFAQGCTGECTARAQVRHRGKSVAVKIRPLHPHLLEVFFSEEWAPVSPGQAAVFYAHDNIEVLGGGTIATHLTASDLQGKIPHPAADNLSDNLSDNLREHYDRP